MRKILLMTVWAMWVTNGVLLAQDAKASTDQKLESVKKLRTQVLSKLPALADLFDPDHNGMAPALGSCRKQFKESAAAVNRQIDAENAKPGDARDQLWLRADCDPALLVAVFTELNNRVDEVKKQATMCVAEYIKRCNEDESSYKE